MAKNASSGPGSEPLARREVPGESGLRAPSDIATAPVTSATQASTLTPATSTQAMRVPVAALTSGRRWRSTARMIGLALFGVGAALLGYVFWQALSGFQAFSQPDYFSLRFNRVAGDDIASRVQGIVAVFGSEVLRVLYLLLLGFLASALASKGIQFFAASEAVIDEAVAADVGM